MEKYRTFIAVPVHVTIRFLGDTHPEAIEKIGSVLQSKVDLSGYYSVIDSMKDQFYGKVAADRLVFYRSELRPDGPVYIPIEAVLFTDQVL